MVLGITAILGMPLHILDPCSMSLEVEVGTHYHMRYAQALRNDEKAAIKDRQLTERSSVLQKPGERLYPLSSAKVSEKPLLWA